MREQKYYCESCGARDGETVMQRDQRGPHWSGIEALADQPAYTVEYVIERGYACQHCRTAPHVSHNFHPVTGESESMKGAINWKRVRDERVPPVAEGDPALASVYAQLRWLEKHVTPEGNEPSTGRPWTELRTEFKQNLLDEIERYRWRKAGYEPTQEILDACRDSKKEIKA